MPTGSDVIGRFKLVAGLVAELGAALLSAAMPVPALAVTQELTIDAVDTNGASVRDAQCDVTNRNGTWRVVTPATAQITPGGEWLKVKCATSAGLAGASTSIGASGLAPRRVDALPGALRDLTSAPAAKVRVVMRDLSGAGPASPGRPAHQIVQTAPVPMFLAKVPVAAEASASVAAVTIPVAESDPAPVTPPPVPPVLGLIAALRSSTTASSAAPAARVIDLHDVKAIPYLSAAGREAYFDFLRYPLPRAFAISRNGGWGFGVRGTDPCTMALDNCERRGGPCHIYAFNQQVVPAVTGTP